MITYLIQHSFKSCDLFLFLVIQVYYKNLQPCQHNPFC